MIQLELYVSEIDKVSDLFEEAFGMSKVMRKPGFAHLRHPKGFDIMLFNPSSDEEVDRHWSLPTDGNGGMGIEIVIISPDATQLRAAVTAHGYLCSDLKHTNWGSLEFTFRLAEGYLLRVKELTEASNVAGALLS